MRTSDYWARRMLAVAAEQQADDEALYRRVKRDYESALHNLDGELSKFYARYAANESITMAEARKLLSEAERETFKMSLDEFRDKAIAGGWDKQLDEVYLRSRISRLQALQTQIEARVMELHQSQRDVLREHLTDAYKNTYYRTIYEVSHASGLLTTFAKLDAETVESIIARPWVGDSFSGRIWKDRDKLSRELETLLSQAIIRGDPLQRTAAQLAKRMGVAESRAMTLVSTESAHAAAEASMRGYKETGVEEYRFEAGFDAKTCEVCAALDGKTFRRSEAKTGINYPPIHPRCRCTTAPVSDFQIGTEKAARDPVTGKSIRVPKDMSYKEWRGKYVDNHGKSDIIDLHRNAARKTSNVGAFADLKVPMQKREVLDIAKQYGVDMRGITVKIQRSEKLLALPMTGSTDYKSIGRIDLFPRAFEDREQLVRTLLHEKCHVKQLRKYGADYAQKNLAEIERRAYRFESFWYKALRKRVRK